MLRVLATWDEAAFPIPDDEDPETYRACGMLLGELAEGDFVQRFDPRPSSFQPDHDEDGRDLNDCGWIGEGPDGIWISYHPLAALTLEEELWDVYSAWQLGLRSWTASERSEMSHFECLSFAILASARQREEIRRARERGDGEET